MNNKKQAPSAQTEQAMQRVLQAERDAERSIQDCEDEAQQYILDAQIRAQKIHSRADQRISNMEMRHGHKLNRLIKDIERQGAVELRNDAEQQVERDTLQSAVKRLATELCKGNSASHDETEAGR